jgi:hypothetical protein
MIDRTTKILLLVIALGLWANVLVGLIKPITVKAQSTTHDLDDIYKVLDSIDSDVGSIQSDVSSIDSNVSSMEGDLGRIQRGSCANDTICK